MPGLFFDTYASYGLSESPFLVHALKPDERGKRLLVGRDKELRLVCQKLHKHGKITCLDGHVGVGKTSLVNVAAYMCFEAFLAGDSPQLLIPMPEAFQLKKDEDVHAFCADVYRRVAQTLLRYRTHFRELGLQLKNAERLDAWLNSPIAEHLNSTLGVGVSVGVPGAASASATGGGATSQQINTSAGFSDQGFEQTVRDWLSQIFTVEGNGGVVCVIDNLELLETAAQSRRVLEALRDRLFNVNGLRWAFCGANGVIHSLGASQRLSSYLNAPVIEVGHVHPSALEPLFRARFREFAMKDEHEVEQNLPISLADLKHLYLIVNYNLRDLLSLADEYCDHLADTASRLTNDTQKAIRFTKWLSAATSERYSALKSRLPSDAWTILDLVMGDDFRGTFGIGDYDSIKSNSTLALAQSTFEKRLRDLVKHDLISKTIDDDQSQREDGDFKRDIFSVTAKGSMVHYARLLRNETQGIKPVTWLRRVHG